MTRPVRVPMADLSAQHASIRAELREAFERVLVSGRYVLGAEVERLETELAARVGVEHAIGVSSGTDALLCGLMALGVGPGDEVITTPFTFFATIEVILRLGAIPRFVDVRKDTFNLDERAVERVIGPRTKVILPVHLFGVPADCELLERVAAERGLAVFEDAAQALGARLRDRPAGSFGRIAALSFHPTKPLGGLGDGGMILSNDRDLAERCRSLRSHGSPTKHRHQLVGGNFRLDALQAALLTAKLPCFDGWLRARRDNAEAYAAALDGIDGLVLPRPPPDVVSAWAQFTLRVSDGRRDALAAALARDGIESAVHYPLPVHRQPALERLGLAAASFPEAERAAAEALSIPVHAELTIEQRDHVIRALHRFFRS